MQHWADIQLWENAKMLNSIQMCGDKERFLLSCNVFQLRKLLVVLFHWTPQSSAHNQQPTIPAAWGLLCALLWPDAVNLSHLSSLLLTRTESSAALALLYCTCLSYSSLETGESHVSLLIAQHFLLWCVRLNAEFSDATRRTDRLSWKLSLSSTMSIRDRVRFALCKQLTCACSALSTVTCEEPVSSLPFAHATLQYGWPFSVREGEQTPIMVYLILWLAKKALEHLSDKKAWMDVSAIEEKQCFIRLLFFFWEYCWNVFCITEERWYLRNLSNLIKRTLLRDRILIFNSPQSYQLNPIPSRIINCFAQTCKRLLPKWTINHYQQQYM